MLYSKLLPSSLVASQMELKDIERKQKHHAPNKVIHSIWNAVRSIRYAKKLKTINMIKGRAIKRKGKAVRPRADPDVRMNREGCSNRYYNWIPCV